MKSLRIAVAAALLATSGAAFAQSASDAKCLILSNAYAGQAKDEDGKKMAQSAFYFYLGRIGPNATAAQLKSLLDQQVKTLTDATAGKLMTDCANGVAAKVQMVQSIADKPKPQQSKQPQGR